MPFDTATPPVTAVTEKDPSDTARLLKRLGRRSIVFVGIMGAGKTVIGRRVAAMCNLPFHDSDHEIEKVSRMTIPELFATYGEPEFRALEERVIERLLRNGPQVISTGGGAFMSETTRNNIKRRGVSVWLKADIETLMNRVSRRQNRPLLNTENPREVMERLMAARCPVYSLADVTIHSRDVSKDQIAAEVIAALLQHLPAPRKRKRKKKKPQ